MNKVIKMFENGMSHSDVFEAVETILEAGKEAIQKAPDWAKKDKNPILEDICELSAEEIMAAFATSVSAAEKLGIINEIEQDMDGDRVGFVFCDCDDDDDDDEDECDGDCEDCELCEDCEFCDECCECDDGPCVDPDCDKELVLKADKPVKVAEDGEAMLFEMECENGHKAIAIFEMIAIFPDDTEFDENCMPCGYDDDDDDDDDEEDDD